MINSVLARYMGAAAIIVSATILAGCGALSPQDNTGNYLVSYQSAIVPTPVISSAVDLAFPFLELVAGQAMTPITFYNTASNFPIAFTCSYGLSSSQTLTTDCKELAGATFSEGTLSYTPDATTAWGTYKFQITGTNYSGSGSTTFFANIRQPYPTDNLQLDFDANFAGLTGPATSGATIWRNLAVNSSYGINLSTNLRDGSLKSTSGTWAFTGNYLWAGTGDKSNPYSLGFVGGSSPANFVQVTNFTTTNSQLMLSLWISPNAAAGGSVILSTIGTSGAGFQLIHKLTDPTKLQFIIGPINSAPANTPCTTADSVSLAGDQWYHIGIVYDGTTASLYQNGDFECSITAPNSLSYTLTPIIIGADSFGSNAWGGNLADLKIYQSGSNTDLLTIFNATKPRFPNF